MARAGLNTERVVRAGGELADEVGFEQVTLSRLARHFDVRVASLYSHVRDLGDLRTRIALRSLEEMADRGTEALAGRAGRDALAALGGVYRDYARQHPGRYAAARHPLDARSAQAGAGPRHTRLLQAVLSGYAIDGTEAVHAVRFVGAAFHGYISLELAGAYGHSEPGSEASWTRAVDALDALLRRWPAEPAPAPAPAPASASPAPAASLPGDRP